MNLTINNVEQKLQQLLAQVPFFQNAKLSQDTRGHSGVLCLVVERSELQSPTQKFFAKVYPGDNRAHLLAVEQIYQQLNIPTAKIVNLQYLPATNETICSYEYIKGPTLKEILPQCTVAEYEALGYQVGAELRKFSAITGDPQKFQTEFDVELKQLWQNIFQQKSEYNLTQTDKLPVINLHRLRKNFEQLKTYVYATTPVFVHNDINLSNIIIYQGRPYFIDTDGGAIKFRALDFRGNCWWGWTGNQVTKERAVYRGIYRGLFQDQIPASFHHELAFTMIYEFILRVYKYRNDPEQIHYSFLRWYDILTLTHYFENYHFSWF